MFFTVPGISVVYIYHSVCPSLRLRHFMILILDIGRSADFHPFGFPPFILLNLQIYQRKFTKTKNDKEIVKNLQEILIKFEQQFQHLGKQELNEQVMND